MTAIALLEPLGIVEAVEVEPPVYPTAFHSHLKRGRAEGHAHEIALSYTPATYRNVIGQLLDRYLALPDVEPPFSGTAVRPSADRVPLTATAASLEPPFSLDTGEDLVDSNENWSPL